MFARIFTEVEFRKLLLAAETVTFEQGCFPPPPSLLLLLLLPSPFFFFSPSPPPSLPYSPLFPLLPPLLSSLHYKYLTVTTITIHREVLVRQGEDTDQIYLILNGECVIEHEDHPRKEPISAITSGDIPQSPQNSEDGDSIFDRIANTFNYYFTDRPNVRRERRERKELLQREEQEKLQARTVGFMKDGELIGEFELLQHHTNHLDACKKEGEASPPRQRFDGTIPLATPTTTGCLLFRFLFPPLSPSPIALLSCSNYLPSFHFSLSFSLSLPPRLL